MGSAPTLKGGGRVGSALVDGHFEWEALLAHGFLEKAQGGLLVAAVR